MKLVLGHHQCRHRYRQADDQSGQDLSGIHLSIVHLALKPFAWRRKVASALAARSNGLGSRVIWSILLLDDPHRD